MIVEQLKSIVGPEGWVADEDDLKRYPKDSYYWYSNIMRNNSITKD